MPLLDPKPDPFRRGQSARLSASALNQIRNIGLRQIRGGKNTDVAYYGDRVVVSGDDTTTSPSVAIYVRQFAVLQEYDDYLLCAVFAQPNNTNGSAWVPQDYDAQLLKDSISLVWVAKPYLLQRTPWDGATATFNGQTGVIAYNSSLGQRSFAGMTQEITPSYVSGDIILAVLCPTGYKNPEDGSLIVWMDLNNGGRVWNGSGGFIGCVLNVDVGQSFTPVSGDSPGDYIQMKAYGSFNSYDAGGFFNSSDPTKLTIPVNGYYNLEVILYFILPSAPPVDALLQVQMQVESPSHITSTFFLIQQGVYNAYGSFVHYNFTPTGSTMFYAQQGSILKLVVAFSNWPTPGGSASSPAAGSRICLTFCGS